MRLILLPWVRNVCDKILEVFVHVQLAILDVSRPHTEVGGMAPGQTSSHFDLRNLTPHYVSISNLSP